MRELGPAARSQKSALSVFKLSKIKYYLVDNIYCFMLSQLIGRVQEESKRAGDRVPTDNSRTDVAIVGQKIGDRLVCPWYRWR
jgi:hypothetical protein